MRWESTAAASSAAAPAQVWGVLLDGRHWSEWNRAVEWMVVEGPLAPGGLVTMKPKRVRQTAFRIEAVEPERLVTLLVTIGPVAALRLRLELEPRQSGTAIVHTVAVSGLLAGLLLQRAARRIATLMPEVLERLAIRAARNPAPPTA